MHRNLFATLLVALLATVGGFHGSAARAEEPAFSACLAGLKATARERGISPEVADAALGQARYSPRVLELDRAQPEFTQTFAQYYLARVTESRVSRGRELLASQRPLLERVLRETGVPPHYLLAFWGLETNFGGYLGKMSTLDSLTTLACDQRRSAFFTEQLVAALQLEERGDAEVAQMRGSWAGALGHVQFMPTAYLRYARDGDGDGRRDLWGSIPDAMVSAGYFLKSLGWVPGLRWGREVILPPGFDYARTGRDNRVPLRDWSAAGITDVYSRELPALAFESSVLVPAGARGPAFVVYDNFDVIMRWNRSEYYAIAVGRLADRIAGAGTLLQPPLDDGLRLSSQLVTTLQSNLASLGFDVGEVDGVFGSQSRAALREFQASRQLVADGYPSRAVIDAIALAAADGETQ